MDFVHGMIRDEDVSNKRLPGIAARSLVGRGEGCHDIVGMHGGMNGFPPLNESG